MHKATNNFYQEKSDYTSDTSSILSPATTKTNESINSKKKIGWANTHLSMASCNKMKDKIILDSGLSTSIICRPGS